MHQICGQIILLLILLFAAVTYERAKQQAPDPYAVCLKMATEAEQRQCKNQVGFALSAGW